MKNPFSRDSWRVETRSLLFVCLASCIFYSCGGEETGIIDVNSEDDASIIWNGASYLKWSDFRKPLDGHEEFTSMSYTRLAVMYNFDADEHLVTVHALFYRDSSYTTVVLPGEEVLKHENMHFNLTEIAARELRSKISGWPGQGVFQDYVQLCFDSVFASLSDRQDAYDRETNHGVNLGIQESWNREIDSLLAATDTLSEATVRVEMKRRYYRK